MAFIQHAGAFPESMSLLIHSGAGEAVKLPANQVPE